MEEMVFLYRVMKRLRDSMSDQTKGLLIRDLKIAANDDIRQSAVEGRGGRYDAEVIDQLLEKFLLEK